MATLDRADFKRLANLLSRTFRDSHGGGIVERFEAVSKILFLKMVDERMVRGNWPHLDRVDAPALAWRDGDVSRTVYERARELWTTVTGGVNARVLQGGRGTFPNDVEAVARAIRQLEPYDLDSLGVDVKGVAYEELLRDTFEKNDNQQYFTPRHLMDFIVEMANPSPEDVICDPACGSGGFLVGALNFVAAHHDGAVADVRGVDIDERMAWVARINVFLHGGAPASVVHIPGAGSLRALPEIQKPLPRGSFSVILTNPPFGSDMTDPAALAGFETGRGRVTRRRGVLFIERCVDLLKPGGLLAVVIDDSILNLESNEDVRRLIRARTTVEAVVSLPDVTFMPYSTAKSSVLLLRKRAEGARGQGPVFMADVENVGNRPNGDPLYADAPAVDGVRPLLSDLPSVAEAWRVFQRDGDLPADAGDYGVFLANVDEYLGDPTGDRLDANFFHPTRAGAEAMLARASVPTYALDDLFDFHTGSVNVAEKYGDTPVEWVGLGDIVASTGEFEATQLAGDRIKSNAHEYSAGDILVSKLRPRLRKVVIVPASSPGGVCSAELLVLRLKSTPPVAVMPEFVAYFLRSDLSYGQQVYQITGVGRPRVGVGALKRLQVPIPSLAEQRRIVMELDAAFSRYQELHARADALRREAHQVLNSAYSASISSVTSGTAPSPRSSATPEVRATA